LGWPTVIQSCPTPARTPALGLALTLVDLRSPFQGAADGVVQFRWPAPRIPAGNPEEVSKDITPSSYSVPMGCHSCAGKVVIPEPATHFSGELALQSCRESDDGPSYLQSSAPQYPGSRVISCDIDNGAGGPTSRYAVTLPFLSPPHARCEKLHSGLIASLP
jgi:hypothetical protein